MNQEEVDVIIEIPKGGHIKYEYNKESSVIVCDRILHTPMKYPFNYGFVPNTLSEDGDPLDVVVLMDDALVPGCMIRCKILGSLETQDDAGNDPKLIVCPIAKVNPIYKNFKNITSVNNDDLGRIQYFFKHYKDLEYKWVKVSLFAHKEEAIQIYRQSIERFNNKYNKTQRNKITNYFKPV